MQRIYLYLRGTVRLRVTGTFPERCCNICANGGVGFWGVTRESEESCLLTVALGDEHRVMELGEKAMCRVEIVSYGGLPSVLYGFRHRYGMIAGLVLLVLVFGVLGRFVLVIDVEGNETVTRSQILSQLQSYGFSVGSYGPGVDVRDLSNKMLMDMEELSYLTINISGIHADVIVRERDPVPEVRDLTEIADVVAARDGVIRKVTVVAGRELVQEGQAVQAGEVLISSLLIHEVPDGSGTVFGSSQVRAEGSVQAYTVHTLSASTPLDALVPDSNAEPETGYALEFLGRHVNFYGNSSILDTDCDKIAILHSITLSEEETLPVGLWELQWRPWAAEPARVNAQSAQAFLKRQLTQRLEELLCGGEVLDMDWQVEQTDGAVTVTLTAQCMEDIGQSVRLNES